MYNQLKDLKDLILNSKLYLFLVRKESQWIVFLPLLFLFFFFHIQLFCQDLFEFRLWSFNTIKIYFKNKISLINLVLLFFVFISLIVKIFPCSSFKIFQFINFSVDSCFFIINCLLNSVSFLSSCFCIFNSFLNIYNEWLLHE
jgi:hypothetical protein